MSDLVLFLPQIVEVVNGSRQCIAAGKRTLRLSVRAGVSIDCLDEFFAIDITVPTTRPDEDRSPVHGSPSGPRSPAAGTLESAFQLLRLVLTSFVFEEDAFERGKQQVLHDYEHYTKDLAVCTENAA